jgi:hypothetical protein
MDGSRVMQLYQPMASLASAFCLQAHRDARVILDSWANNGRPCKPSDTPPEEAKPKLIMVCPNTYHGFGVLPWKTWAPRVVTPNVYSKTKWCCRNITSDERLYSQDVTKLK